MTATHLAARPIVDATTGGLGIPPIHTATLEPPMSTADRLAKAVHRYTRDHPDSCHCLLCTALHRYDQETAR